MGSISYQIPAGQRQLFLDNVGISSHQTRTAPVWDPNEETYELLILGRPDERSRNRISLGFIILLLSPGSIELLRAIADKIVSYV